jgi:Bacterial protein of unknown function (DUF885)
VRSKVLLVPIAVCLFVASASANDDVTRLANDFWAWRAVYQPYSSDDVPRIERPAGAFPDWSPASMNRQREQLEAFEKRWSALDVSHASIAEKVDYRLIGSALARVRWELDINRQWQRNPQFYLDQTLGALGDRLIAPPPFSAARKDDIQIAMQRIPRVLEDARANLTDMRAPFAALAIDSLDQIGPRLTAVAQGLGPYGMAVDPGPAIAALEQFRSWLREKLPGLPQNVAIGRENYVFFMRKVALVPYSPEQLIQMAQQEFSRAVSLEEYDRHYKPQQPKLPLPASMAEQEARTVQDEQAIRAFLQVHDVLTVPAWVRHYRRPPLPGYLAPLAGGDTGVATVYQGYLTGPSHLNEDAVSYADPTQPAFSYDPTLTVHEGFPGHYLQLCLSWANPDPIRRHYYDSTVNEGIAYYAEELMLDTGYFDNDPAGRVGIYDGWRERAAGLETDVKISLGEWTIDDGVQHWLEMGVGPADSADARRQIIVGFDASGPGFSASYQVGKLQIMRLLSDLRRAQGDRFNLRAFHDYIWQNGNVPLSLIRWELLNDASELPAH